MADESLTIRLTAEDQISDTLGQMASEASATADAIGQIASVGTSAMDSVAGSVNTAAGSMQAGVSGAESMASAMDKASSSAEAWAEADRLASQAAEQLHMSLEATPAAAAELETAMQKTSDALDGMNSAQIEAVQQNQEFQSALAEAQAAMEAQSQAYAEAVQASEAYDKAMIEGVASAEQLESMAEEAMHAGENLAEANGRASDAAAQLQEATKSAVDAVADIPPPMEDTAKSTEEAAVSLEDFVGMLSGVGITVGLKEITEALYELCDAFDQAQATVVLATGASGEALDGLTNDMMNAFNAAKSADLGTTATAIGEINTRMAITGSELSGVTDQFLDFANITGTNVQSSVASVTQIMNKWGIESSNLTSVLDQLAYAGQASGISVDGLMSSLKTGQSTFAELGVGLEGAISLMSQMELQGTNTSSVMMGLRNAVAYYANSGQDAAEGLAQTIAQIQSMGDSAEATSLAVDVFGKRAGVELAGAIRSGAVSVETLTGSMKQAEGAVKNTAATALTAGQQWEQAQNKMAGAWANATQPVFDAFVEGLAQMVSGIADFCTENEWLVNALTAGGLALGVAAGAYGVYTAATQIATAVTNMFGAAAGAAWASLGPVALIISGIAAAAAGLATVIGDWVSSMDTATENVNELTPACAAQYTELQSLQAEYDALAAKSGGEVTPAMEALQNQIDALTVEFNDNHETIQDLIGTNDALVESAQSMRDALNEAKDAVEQTERTGNGYAQSLANLSKSTMSAELKETAAAKTTAKLAEMYPQAAAGAQKYAGDVEALSAYWADFAKQQSEADLAKTYADALPDMQAAVAQTELQIEHTKEERDAAQALVDQWNEGGEAQQKLFDQGYNYNDLTQNVYDLDESLNVLNADLEIQQSVVDEAEAGLKDYQVAAKDAFSVMSSADQGQLVAAEIFQGLGSEIEQVINEYNEAYEAAESSFRGQFDLFNQFKAESVNLTDVTSNIESYRESMTQFSEGLERYRTYLENTGQYSHEQIDAIMTEISDFSPQTAGLVQSIDQTLSQAEQGVAGAEEKIAGFSESLAGYEQGITTASDTTGEAVSGAESQMQELLQFGEEIIEGLDLSEGASQAATTTMAAWIQSINDSGGPMKQAAFNNAHAASLDIQTEFQNAASIVDSKCQAIANSMNSIPSEKTITFNLVTNGTAPNVAGASAVGHNALGTTHAENMFIAGESGPELVIGAGGSTVIPAAETADILKGVGDLADILGPSNPLGGFVPENAPTEFTPMTDSRAGETHAAGGVYTININGDGEIKVDPQISPEKVVDIMQENMRPMLLDLVKSEVYEEGQGAYAF